MAKKRKSKKGAKWSKWGWLAGLVGVGIGMLVLNAVGKR